MKHYPTFAIEQLANHIQGDVSAFNWLINNGYPELVAIIGKHFVLAAFVNTIWDDEKAFKFLIASKAFDWAACANIINGDDKAEKALKTAGKHHFVGLSKAILGRIHEDGDRATTPVGMLKSIFNFKKKFD
jgi:hypothetical protein